MLPPLLMCFHVCVVSVAAVLLMWSNVNSMRTTTTLHEGKSNHVKHEEGIIHPCP